MTLATNNYYAHGVIALGESLRQAGTQRELVAMLTEGVSEDMRYKNEYNYVIIPLVSYFCLGSTKLYTAQKVHMGEGPQYCFKL